MDSDELEKLIQEATDSDFSYESGDIEKSKDFSRFFDMIQSSVSNSQSPKSHKYVGGHLDQNVVNKDLALLQMEIYDAIKYENINSFVDVGGKEASNMNFKIEISPERSVNPLMLAVTKGNTEFVEIMLQNPTLDINIIDEREGVNAFWLAAYYGHGDVMSLLAKKGIDVLNRHKVTESNALHIATEKEHSNVVKLLIDSGFPINQTKQGGFTALIISCMFK